MKIFENFEFRKKYPNENEKKNLENFFCKFFYHKLFSFIQNLNLECFQLSFDVHIVHVGQK